MAAGFEAAVKFPDPVIDESFRDGAGNLLPRVERRRFVEAYDAVVGGRGGGDAERLYQHGDAAERRAAGTL